MRRLLSTLVVVAGLAILVWSGGSLIPREHRASSRVTLNQPIDTVWTIVRNPGALRGTWPEMTKAEPLPPDDRGRERWQETVDGFEMQLVVVETVAPTRLITEVVSPPGSAFGGRWVYQLERSEAGTSVTVAEEGWIGPPPFRIMARVMGYHRSIDQYLQALGRHFGESASPRHVP